MDTLTRITFLRRPHGSTRCTSNVLACTSICERFTCSCWPRTNWHAAPFLLQRTPSLQLHYLCRHSCKDAAPYCLVSGGSIASSSRRISSARSSHLDVMWRARQEQAASGGVDNERTWWAGGQRCDRSAADTELRHFAGSSAVLTRCCLATWRLRNSSWISCWRAEQWRCSLDRRCRGRRADVALFLPLLAELLSSLRISSIHRRHFLRRLALPPILSLFGLALAPAMSRISSTSINCSFTQGDASTLGADCAPAARDSLLSLRSLNLQCCAGACAGSVRERRERTLYGRSVAATATHPRSPGSDTSSACRLHSAD